MAEVRLQRWYRGLCWQGITAGMTEHVRVGFKASLATFPARSIIRAKPAVVNGALRSEVNTKGDLGSCSR